MKISIIISTKNRADHLAETLRAIGSLYVPERMPTELIVVDNASTDHTAEIVKNCVCRNMRVRYLYEAGHGKCRALNTSIAASEGEIILFTDDDVRTPHDWIARMCDPILSGSTQAVAGGVKFPAHLNRSWMQPWHRALLASTELMDPANPTEMFGANMAFSRAVLDRVPEFDTELGPGKLGNFEDILFSWQIRQAGYRLISLLDIAVEHHFDVARLSRSSYLERARKQGQSSAYVGYHWEHDTGAPSRRALYHSMLKLAWLRLKNRRECQQPEGMPEWEFRLAENIAFMLECRRQASKPRNYSRHGLIKHGSNNGAQSEMR